MKMDLMSDEELQAFLSYPRHEIVVSENVAQDIYRSGRREAVKLDACEE
jgi:hypothetical protein